jgi:heavy metal sensor kinase
VSIRWRLTLWYGAVLAVVVAAFGSVVYFSARHQLLHRIDEGISEELADVLFEIRRARTEAELGEWLERRFGQHEGFDYQITRTGGERFFANGRLGDKSLPLPERSLSEVHSFQSVSADGHRWRIGSVQARGPAGVLTVQVARPLEELDHESGELLLALLLAGPLTLLVAVSGGYFLARRALAPVNVLRRRTNEITADRLDRRLPVSNPADELGLLAGTINEMIARLERSFAEVRRFTADASHELRTPLAVIHSEAEIALGRASASPEQQARLGSILEECDRLGRLTDQLLSLAREDAGVSRQTRERLDLAALAAGTVETMRPLAEAEGVRLHVGGSASVWVEGDEARLRQVFFNLLDNAIKYTPEGGEVDVRVESMDGRAVATVRDTGEGITAEHLPRVFDRFYRVDKARSRERGGTGLGLSIVRSVVAAHGGNIELDSAPGRGTTARVLLPLKAGGKLDGFGVADRRT